MSAMSENVQPFEWTAQSIEAAQLLADGRLTDAQIGDKAGVTAKTVYRWRKHPEFAAKVAELTAELEARIRDLGIARKIERVRRLNDRADRLQQVMLARAEQYKGFPGGETGMLTKHKRAFGSGDNFVVFEEYEVDTGLLREMREHEKQAAVELGQWAEKHEHSGPAGGPIEIVEIVRGSEKKPPADDATSPG